MKVIHELVAYFDRRGLLAQAHLTRLLDQGLLAHEAPRTMVEHCGPPGQSYYFRVTGEIGGKEVHDEKSVEVKAGAITPVELTETSRLPSA